MEDGPVSPPLNKPKFDRPAEVSGHSAKEHCGKRSELSRTQVACDGIGNNAAPIRTNGRRNKKRQRAERATTPPPSEDGPISPPLKRRKLNAPVRNHGPCMDAPRDAAPDASHTPPVHHGSNNGKPVTYRNWIYGAKRKSGRGRRSRRGGRRPERDHNNGGHDSENDQDSHARAHDTGGRDHDPEVCDLKSEVHCNETDERNHGSKCRDHDSKARDDGLEVTVNDSKLCGHGPGVRVHDSKVREDDSEVRDHGPEVHDHSPGVRDHDDSGARGRVSKIRNNDLKGLSHIPKVCDRDMESRKHDTGERGHDPKDRDHNSDHGSKDHDHGPRGRDRNTEERDHDGKGRDDDSKGRDHDAEARDHDSEARDHDPQVHSHDSEGRDHDPEVQRNDSECRDRGSKVRGHCPGSCDPGSEMRSVDQNDRDLNLREDDHVSNSHSRDLSGPDHTLKASPGGLNDPGVKASQDVPSIPPQHLGAGLPGDLHCALCDTFISPFPTAMTEHLSWHHRQGRAPGRWLQDTGGVKVSPASNEPAENMCSINSLTAALLVTEPVRKSVCCHMVYLSAVTAVLTSATLAHRDYTGSVAGAHSRDDARPAKLIFEMILGSSWELNLAVTTYMADRITTPHITSSSGVMKQLRTLLRVPQARRGIPILQVAEVYEILFELPGPAP